MENLTSSQKSIWITEQYYKGSSVNNISGYAMMEEQVDFEKLEEAIQIICQKHDNFWLKLKIEDGEVKQVLSERKKVEIDTMVFATKNELEEAAKKIAKTPFNVEKSELFKFYIFKLENGQGGFMPSVHHLICDAWTIALISNEVIKAYSDLKHNQEVETEAIYSYIDYIKSEQEYLQSPKYQKDKTYWEEKFTQIPEVATIPGSKENVDESNPSGNRKKFEIQGIKVEKIKQYCKENKISLYNFFMAIYAIYIGEISNLDEFVIGTPILNRTNFKEKNAMGMFVNMAPFKINMSQDIDFKAFVKNIASDSLGMLKHQKYSYQHLLENLRSKNKSLPNLYNIFLSYQITNAHQSGEDMDYTIEWVYNGCCAEHIDIQIFDINDTGDLSISYDYKTSIYEESDIENLHERILNVINQVIEKENIELKDIEIVTTEERKKLVEDFNKTELKYDEKETVISLFEKQAEKTPSKTAIICNGQKLTYKELNEKANMLASNILEKGVKQKDVIGIMVNRSPEMMIGLVAILKCGAAYLPIDPEYPAERISYMLENSETKLVLVNDNTEKYVPANCGKINIKNIENQNKENLDLEIDGNTLVYLIYTSGSTGKPKGVQITNRNLNNFIKGMKKEIDFNPNKAMVSVTTICFDIFGLEMWCSLTEGLTLVVANELEQNMPALLNKLCLENNVNMIQTTPSRYSVLFEDTQDLKFFENVTEILVGGEAVNDKILANMKRYSNAKIFNVYGPTETTIWSTIKELTNEEKITVGKPIVNTQCYILNKNHKLLPINMPGELYIGGDGVSNGYLKRDDLNEEKFIKSPFVENSKIYNTNDLAYFTEDGEIIHLGRTDFQVKIRGFRIELGEIENSIEKNENINQAVVVKKKLKNGHDALIAYYTTNASKPEIIEELKQALNNELPQYMVPQYFVEIEKMPHTPNGKIDRKALPEPEGQEADKEIIKPRNELDKDIIKIIGKMLRLEQISLEDKLLDLGGDSLTAITLSTKILSKYNVQINIKDIISGFTIKDISDYIKENQEKGTSKIKIEKATEQETYPLSSAQKRIYYNSKMIGEDNLVYNMPGGIMVEEILDKEKVKNAFEKIIERHSSLRTSFILQENDVVQKINENVEFDVAEFHNTENEIQEILEHFSKPFKLEGDLLIRVELHYIDNKKTLLLVEAHHVIMDGTSLNNLIIEFERLYNGDNLKRIPIQYKDYAVWENQFNESEGITKYEQYWVNKFKNAELSQLHLPYDYKMSGTRSYKGNKISNVIDEKQFRKIEKYAKKIGVSPYMLFISAYFIMLYKYTGQEEITLGSPIANRDINETKRMIGMFVNNIVVKANVKSEETFQEFLNKMKEQILDDISNQPYPYDMLVKKLGIKGDNSRNPLFDVLFTYQNKEENMLHLDEHEVEVIEIDNEIAKFNLSLEIKPKTHTINIEYCTDLFKKQTIERMFEHYMNVIEAIVNDNNVKISEISIISEQEKNKILYEFNDSKIDYPKDKTIAQIFGEKAIKNQNTIAVKSIAGEITYEELDKKSNYLANKLINLGIKPGDVIGINLNRSIELIIAMMATLKIGAIYMPMYVGYPKDRLEYMLQNSSAKMLIYKDANELEFDGIKEKIDSFKTIKEDEKLNEEIALNSEEVAYIIYTSGSTGKPKGVQIKHANLINFVKAFKQYYDNKINAKDRFLASTNISFDVSIWEIFLPLLNGATLVLYQEEIIQDIVAYTSAIQQNEITGLYIPPNILEEVYNILKNKENIKINKMLVGVEPIRKTVLNKYYNLNNNLVIVNGYGPTETTICCTALKYEKDEQDGIVSIGRPLKNDNIYILSSDQNLQPIGVPGEIYVTGAGVGKGYINKKTETEKNFLENVMDNESEKMYKTGDIAKWNEDGTIKFIGRNDSQIKLSGHRIELSEINHTIMEYPSIIKSYTTILKKGEKNYIVGYYIAEKEISSTDLEAFLKEKLADYMVPNFMMQLQEFPLTPNGKIDKEKLPTNFGTRAEYVEPRDEFEKQIAEIFKKLFLLKKVGIDDNFFDLGGDSVLAMRLQIEAAKENLNITYANIFKHPTIRELAKQVNENKNNKVIKKYPTSSNYPISSAQKRMYIASNMEKDSTMYNITGGLLMNQEPDLIKLQQSVDKIVQRQDVLKTYFDINEEGNITQKTCEKLNVEIELINAETNDINKIFNIYQTKFNLNKPPLFKVLLIKLPNKKFLLMLDVHHIIFDGTSLKIFLKEISDLYNGKELEENDISYKDFAIWENTNLETEGLKNSKEFWLKQFEKDIPILNMPTTYTRGAKKSFIGSTYTKLISKELTNKIESFSKKNNVTPYIVMLSAYYILLYKYTGQEDIIVGTPVSGRIYEELEQIIGMFVNSLPLRQQITANSNFNDFLLNVKEKCVECLSHQDYPFDTLVNELGISKDASRNPLFDFMFIYQSDIYKDVKFGKIDAKYCIPKSKTSKFDISLEISPKKDGMNMSFEYCTEIFNEEFIIQLAQHYCNILEVIINSPETKIEDVVMIDDNEKNKLLHEFNNIRLPYDKNVSIIQLFEQQVLKTPNNVALVFENEELTFKELNEKANQLGKYLIKNGVGEKSVVGIMLPRSLEIMVAIIAVLKTGACYIPIDPTLPKKRIDYMVSNSNVCMILTKDIESSKISVNNNFNISIKNSNVYEGEGKNINKKINPESPSYIIYTSGSTGNPKGVVLNHKALTNLAIYLNDTVEFLKNEYANIAMCSITTISFDIFIFETLICLQRGVKIIIANEAEQNTPNLLDKLIEKNDVKAIQMTPSRMYIYVNNKEIMPHLSNLEYVVLAGEALPKDLLNQILSINPNAKVYNGYGPSETTVFATFTDVTKYENITIGKPIANTRIYILDKDKNICPIGIPGELYIAGDGIGIGYSNNEEITKERFINDIFYPNEKMYKTGDLAKYLPNGELFYIGRVDNQIKIRGLRIELDEIEKCILQYQNIDKCIIASKTDSNNRQFIVAYLSVTDRISINKLRVFLKTILPKYMIPSYFVILDKIPYLNNGKIDKKALAKLKINETEEVEKEYVAPKNKIEIDIVNLFENLLAITPIGVDDNFFELGGDSLLAINLQVELLKMDYNITYSDLFMNPTIRELENLIIQNKKIELNDMNTSEFAEFEDILNNNCDFAEDLKYKQIGNVLITGTTGYLGAHVLAEFLESEKGKAYCLIRSEPGLSVKNKLLKKLHYYFGNIYDKLIDDRIIIVNANIIKKDFGMEEEEINNLFKNISCVINCAAKVTHYGNYNDYKMVNVIGTQNLLDLCLKYKKKFYQISTLSISGNHLVNGTDDNQIKYIFKENDFYINQTLENVYVKSKFEAEKLVFNYILKGLDGYICRVGNLMNRYIDGKFQQNVDENASINRILSIINIGCLPEGITNINLEFTPVDNCAKAIIKLTQYPSKNNRVFHLYNQNYVSVKQFINVLNDYADIDIVSEEKFTKRIKKMLKREDANKMLAGVLTDLDSNGRILQESPIKLNSDFTIKYLSKIGFEWSKINDTYLKQFLEYFITNGYMNKREEKK